MPDPITMTTTAAKVSGLLRFLDNTQVSMAVYQYVVPFGHDVARSAAEQLGISLDLTGDDDADTDRLLADLDSHGDASVTILTDNMRAAYFAVGVLTIVKQYQESLAYMTDDEAEDLTTRLEASEPFMNDLQSAALAYQASVTDALFGDITDPRD